ncbi:MAG: hypothetical protein AAF393_17815, partial [Pseudomonadota bacterium]
FNASSATFALNSGLWRFRFDISDLLLVEDQQTTNRSLRQRPKFGGSSNIGLSVSLFRRRLRQTLFNTKHCVRFRCYWQNRTPCPM